MSKPQALPAEDLVKANRRFPKYSTYRESGVRWFNNIPARWKAVPIKRVVSTPVTDGPHETPEFLHAGVPFISADAIKDNRIDFARKRGFISEADHKRYSKKYIPRRGDIYLVKSGATTGNVAMVETDDEFNIWSPLAAIRPDQQTAYSRFLFYLFRSSEFRQSIELGWSYGTQQNIGMNVIENLPVLLPPLSEQRIIAVFLDRETAKIDASVAKKERLIELLQEKRTALISHVVTKGLNLDVKMKDSDVVGFGKVPHHWQLLRVKALTTTTVSGPFGSSLKKDVYTSSGFRVYGQEQVIPGDFSVGDYYISPEKYVEMSRYAVRPGDVLVSCVGTFGKVAVVPLSAEPGIINPRLIRLSPNQDIVGAEYLAELLRSSAVYAQMNQASRGGTMDIINLAILRNIHLAIPPLDEQEQINRFLVGETAKIDRLVRGVQSGMDALSEYRTALISAAVTGKIDVREEVSCP